MYEKSRAHHSHPDTAPPGTVEFIRTLRSEKPVLGAKKIALRLQKRHGITMHWRGVHKVLKREGLVKTKKRLPINRNWARKPFLPGKLLQIVVAFIPKYKGNWLYQLTSIVESSRCGMLK